MIEARQRTVEDSNRIRMQSIFITSQPTFECSFQRINRGLDRQRVRAYSFDHALLTGTQSAKPREDSFRGRSLFPRARRRQQRHRDGDEERRPDERGLLPAFREQGRPLRGSNRTGIRRDGKRDAGCCKVSTRRSGSAGHDRTLSKRGSREFARNRLRTLSPRARTRTKALAGAKAD